MPRKHTARGHKQLRRRAANPSRVATANNAIVARQFRYTTTIALDTANTSQGGVVNFFSFNNPISDYIGSEYIFNNHEQFRVKRIQLLARPSTGLFPQTTEDASVATVVDILNFQIAQYNTANWMEVQSFIDYDDASAPTSYEEILSRPNTKIQCLSPHKWTKVASFAPKLTLLVPDSSSPTVVMSQNQWQTTNYTSASLYGCRGRFSLRYNQNPAFNNRVAVDIFAIATVEMRGVRNNSCTTTTSVPRPFGNQKGVTFASKEAQNDTEDEET